MVQSPYIIRWGGMLRPLYAETYTIYAVWQARDFRIKVTVDNILLITRSSSVGTNEMIATLAFKNAGGHLYDIDVEYHVGSGGDAGFNVTWSTLGGMREVTLLCHVERLQVSFIEILPGMPVEEKSELKRCAMDFDNMVPSYNQLCFQLLLRDEFGNDARPNMSNIQVVGRDQLEQMVYLDDFSMVELTEDFSMVELTEAHQKSDKILVFTITFAGRFSTHVQISGNHIMGSPFSVQVHPGKPSLSS